MHSKRAMLWFRQDLRLHDNEALHDALKSCDQLLPVYIFDERSFFSEGKYGFEKTGKFRAQFIIEAVDDLRRSLREKGSDLLVAVGKPEEIIFDLAGRIKSSWVFCNRERTSEEIAVQDALESRLWTIGQEVRYSRGKMLYYTQDLPFPVTHTPDVFSTFKKEVERLVPIRPPLEIPAELKYEVYRDLEMGDMPTNENFDKEPVSLKIQGGEAKGLERLNYYLWESDLVKTYKETRNGLLAFDSSSKLSAYLAQGCLSPKFVFQEIKRYEAERGENESTYWLFYELLWRDFFRLIGKKYGDKIFLQGGIFDAPPTVDRGANMEDAKKWQRGETGVPFIDANMKELIQTGFMSNRGRQNVASYLVNDLKVNWQFGAEFFEALLIDYDPMSNWGNWNYLAGVGTDPRPDRYFNIDTQAKRYDPEGKYVKYWLSTQQDDKQNV